MKVTGHRVLVTGGTMGIGQAIAAALVERGNRVAICGRDPERLQAAQAVLGDVEIIVADLAKPDAADSLASAANAALGGLTMLVNNAGIQYNDRYGETSPETVLANIENEIRVNFSAVAGLTAACLPALQQSDNAAIVNISSALAIAPKASAPVYCATKAAVHSFSRALRWQLRDTAPSVHVLEVLPPLVDTNMTRDRTGPKLSPTYVADCTIRALQRDQNEIYVGKAKLLRLINSIAPGIAAAVMRNK